MAKNFSERLADYTWHPVVLGRSDAEVFCLTAPGKPTLFLKRSEAAYSAGRRDEAARLRWLYGKLPVPEVVHFHEDEHGATLVMTAVSGLDLTKFNGESSEVKRRLTEALARALRRFHALDTHGCPFDHGAERELGRLEKGLSARASVKNSAEVRAAYKKLEALRRQQPEETLVLTHGDACLPNVLVQDGELSGFVDLGAAGLGDPHRDLERACWSLGYNYGEGYDEVFLRAYGATELDREKLEFYRGLEYFSIDDT